MKTKYILGFLIAIAIPTLARAAMKIETPKIYSLVEHGVKQMRCKLAVIGREGEQATISRHYTYTCDARSSKCVLSGPADKFLTAALKNTLKPTIQNGLFYPEKPLAAVINTKTHVVNTKLPSGYSLTTKYAFVAGNELFGAKATVKTPNSIMTTNFSVKRKNGIYEPVKIRSVSIDPSTNVQLATLLINVASCTVRK